MQNPLRTLGVFNNSYCSYSCLNLVCSSYRNPINISTVGNIRLHTWIMDSLYKHRAEFNLLSDDIKFASFKGTDLGKCILELARAYIRTQCDCRTSMINPSQMQIDEIRQWEQRQDVYVSSILLESINSSEILNIKSVAGAEINSGSSILPDRLFERETAAVEHKAELTTEIEGKHQGASPESLTQELNYSQDMGDEMETNRENVNEQSEDSEEVIVHQNIIYRCDYNANDDVDEDTRTTCDDSLQRDDIFVCLKDSKNPGSGLHFYDNAGNMMQLPALQFGHIVISKITHELFLELLKSTLISNINKYILFRLHSLYIFRILMRECLSMKNTTLRIIRQLLVY